ncbi:hypothetical protein BJ742DRAFT_782283 [Cladochytrium replicatum]|nr:hypothetical protein BJ742DRAFT_782283 [Cladochytrium replicatum]
MHLQARQPNQALNGTSKTNRVQPTQTSSKVRSNRKPATNSQKGIDLQYSPVLAASYPVPTKSERSTTERKKNAPPTLMSSVRVICSNPVHHLSGEEYRTEGSPKGKRSVEQPKSVSKTSVYEDDGIITRAESFKLNQQAEKLKIVESTAENKADDYLKELRKRYGVDSSARHQSYMSSEHRSKIIQPSNIQEVSSPSNIPSTQETATEDIIAQIKRRYGLDSKNARDSLQKSDVANFSGAVEEHLHFAQSQPSKLLWNQTPDPLRLIFPARSIWEDPQPVHVEDYEFLAPRLQSSPAKHNSPFATGMDIHKSEKVLEDHRSGLADHYSVRKADSWLLVSQMLSPALGDADSPLLSTVWNVSREDYAHDIGHCRVGGRHHDRKSVQKSESVCSEFSNDEQCRQEQPSPTVDTRTRKLSNEGTSQLCNTNVTQNAWSDWDPFPVQLGPAQFWKPCTVTHGTGSKSPSRVIDLVDEDLHDSGIPAESTSSERKVHFAENFGRTSFQSEIYPSERHATSLKSSNERIENSVGFSDRGGNISLRDQSLEKFSPLRSFLASASTSPFGTSSSSPARHVVIRPMKPRDPPEPKPTNIKPKVSQNLLRSHKPLFDPSFSATLRDARSDLEHVERTAESLRDKEARILNERSRERWLREHLPENGLNETSEVVSGVSEAVRTDVAAPKSVFAGVGVDHEKNSLGLKSLSHDQLDEDGDSNWRIDGGFGADISKVPSRSGWASSQDLDASEQGVYGFVLPRPRPSRPRYEWRPDVSESEIASDRLSVQNLDPQQMTPKKTVLRAVGATNTSSMVIPDVERSDRLRTPDILVTSHERSNSADPFGDATVSALDSQGHWRWPRSRQASQIRQTESVSSKSNQLKEFNGDPPASSRSSPKSSRITNSPSPSSSSLPSPGPTTDDRATSHDSVYDLLPASGMQSSIQSSASTQVPGRPPASVQRNNISASSPVTNKLPVLISPKGETNSTKEPSSSHSKTTSGNRVVPAHKASQNVNQAPLAKDLAISQKVSKDEAISTSAIADVKMNHLLSPRHQEEGVRPGNLPETVVKSSDSFMKQKDRSSIGPSHSTTSQSTSKRTSPQHHQPDAKEHESKILKNDDLSQKTERNDYGTSSSPMNIVASEKFAAGEQSTGQNVPSLQHIPVAHSTKVNAVQRSTPPASSPNSSINQPINSTLSGQPIVENGSIRPSPTPVATAPKTQHLGQLSPTSKVGQGQQTKSITSKDPNGCAMTTLAVTAMPDSGSGASATYETQRPFSNEWKTSPKAKIVHSQHDAPIKEFINQATKARAFTSKTGMDLVPSNSLETHLSSNNVSLKAKVGQTQQVGEIIREEGVSRNEANQLAAGSVVSAPLPLSSTPRTVTLNSEQVRQGQEKAQFPIATSNPTLGKSHKIPFGSLQKDGLHVSRGSREQWFAAVDEFRSSTDHVSKNLGGISEGQAETSHWSQMAMPIDNSSSPRCKQGASTSLNSPGIGMQPLQSETSASNFPKPAPSGRSLPQDHMLASKTARSETSSASNSLPQRAETTQKYIMHHPPMPPSPTSNLSDATRSQSIKVPLSDSGRSNSMFGKSVDSFGSFARSSSWLSDPFEDIDPEDVDLDELDPEELDAYVSTDDHLRGLKGRLDQVRQEAAYETPLIFPRSRTNNF